MLSLIAARPVCLDKQSFLTAPGCWDCAVLHVSLYKVVSSGECINNAVQAGVGVKGAVRRKALVW